MESLLKINNTTYDDIKHIYNFLLCAQQINGPNSYRLPGREAMRNIMKKKRYLNSGDPCIWKLVTKILKESNLIEAKPNAYTKLTKYTIGEFISFLQIGLNRYDVGISSHVTESTISCSNDTPCYIKNRRKQLAPKKAALS